MTPARMRHALVLAGLASLPSRQASASVFDPLSGGGAPAFALIVVFVFAGALVLAGAFWWRKRFRSRRGSQLRAAASEAQAETRRVLREQRESEARLLHSMTGAGIGAWSVNLETGASWRSAQYDRIFGYPFPLPHWTLKTFLEHVIAEDRDAVEQALTGAREPADGGMMTVEFECRIRRTDGAVRWIDVRGSRETHGDAGSIIFGLVQDITERKNAEAELQEGRRRLVEKQRRLAEAQQIARVGSWNEDFGEGVLSISDELQRMFGLKVGRFRGDFSNFLACIHPDDRESVARAIRNTRLTHAPFFFEHRVIKPDGEVRLIEAQGRVVFDEQGVAVGMAGTGHDITERQAAEEHLHRLAHYDYLTALPNRKLFYDTLDREVEVGRRQGWSVALLFVDLDRFKYVNDTFGHAVGDELLRKVAERILSCTRVRDTVGRLGGDEFGLIAIASAGGEDFTHLAEKLVEQFRQPFLLSGHEVTVTASVGVAVCPGDATDAVSLTRQADLAMYYAKGHGRNAYRFYTPGMNDRAREKQVLEQALRQALAKGEFELHYQPEIDIESGEWTGTEALLRWHRPGHGVVMPEQFVPALEECGLIVPVGRWVIEAACRQLEQWRQEGMATMSISVNVSARQLRPGGLRVGDHDSGDGIVDGDVVGGDAEGICDHVARCVRNHGIIPGTLQLELTETALMSHPENVVGVLGRLKETGVRILVDDFGTGYSSLAYLKRFPIDTLKVDREFIRDLMSDADDRSITRAIIQLAHSLKLTVIAEGVETRAQLDFLQDERCDQAQGYYIARPMPAEELSRLFMGNARGLGRDFERRQSSLFERGIVPGTKSMH